MNLILNDICTPKSSSLKLVNVLENGNYPVYGASGICGYLNDFQTEKEAIAIVKDGAGIGRVHLMFPKSSVLGTMQIIVPNKNVNAEYLYYLLQYMDLGSTFDGATIPHIYFKNYSKKEIKQHAYEEQKKISKELSKIDKLILNKNNVLITLDQLIKSRFIEMFGNKDYPIYKWLEVTKIINGKDYKKIPNINGTYPIYGSGGYMNLRCDQYLCNENSTIIGRKGNVTNPIFVKEKFWNVDTAFGIEVNEKLNPIYFYYHSLTVDLKSMVTGAAIPSMTKSELQKLDIPIPPLEEQNRFAKFVELIDKSKFIVQKQIKELQELLDSKMDEYFR